ncbi:MAG: rRNA maturation RNase YbeY [Pseudomonadota bacterium]
MKLQVDIQSASAEPAPDEDDIRAWIAAALTGRKVEAEVSVRLVDEAEMARLNQTYRDKPGSTNVLSFPAALPEDIDHPLLGDIVLCPAVVNREAAEQGKTSAQHWTHMLVHGSLHLLGYDHLEPGEAETMESLETAILAQLGLPCPYHTDLAGASA